jgi:hypothetical protein
MRSIYTDRVTRLLFTVLLTAIVTACASSPIAVAETPAQKFYAAKLTYDAVLSGALDLVNDGNVPVDVRRTIQQAAIASGDVYRQANQAYTRYVAARGELAAGETTNDKLNIAAASLTNWLTQLEDTAEQLAAVTQRQ